MITPKTLPNASIFILIKLHFSYTFNFRHIKNPNALAAIGNTVAGKQQHLLDQPPDGMSITPDNTPNTVLQTEIDKNHRNLSRIGKK